jgi:hypothetical protein
MVFSGLTSKPVTMVVSGLTSKPVVTVFADLASKSVVCFLFEPQNQDGGGFSFLALKTESCCLMIWTSKSA